jgi:hypothetical protein
MLKKYSLVMLVAALLVFGGNLLAQDAPDSATVRYKGVEFSYVPDAFGAVQPTFDEGTPYQTDAPYFANVAPHISIKFIRPNPQHPDINFTGELRVYRIADLESYNEPSYREVVQQLRNLNTSDLSAYETVSADYTTPALPFMPVLNAAQVFRAHPATLNFLTVTGIEYYAYYSQSPSPILEGEVMYAYQGITVDEKYYLSFSMPIQTGLLQSEIGEGFDWNTFVGDYKSYLDRTFAAIDYADPATFAPSPALLRQFIASISTSA